MSKILVASRDQAIDLLKTPKYNGQISAIVSISNPEQPVPEEVLKSKEDKVVLILKFHDMEKEMLNNPICRDWEPPQKKHMLAIIEHSKEILNSGEMILCHCMAGISRSAAAAFILKCIELGSGKEKKALFEILKSRSVVSPNNLMVEIAQGILGEGWDLMVALKDIQNLRMQVGHLGDSVVESMETMEKKYPNIPIIKRIQRI